MSVHISFSKKDLIKIIEDNNLNINTKLNRHELCKILIENLDSNKLYYLLEPNTNKKITIDQKNEIILIGKKIKSYVKSGLDNSKDTYNNTDDAICDGIYIAQYGDISSVRKAINLLNQALDINIELTISEKVKNELLEKEKIKKNQTPRLQIKHGKYVVEF